ncbi:MAG: FAD-dependent oxidoreductase [Candidatus Coprovivens sp.]
MITQDIQNKANYCLSCINKPCTKGCPLKNDIAGFIKLIKEEKLEEAYQLLSETTILESICGRICPHSKQCQGSCIRGIKGKPVSIGELETYIGDLAIKNNWDYFSPKKEMNKKVAIIGSGPAGLSCAAFLRKQGIQVTIYEKHDYLGGLLRHGIPEFRLSKETLDQTINKIISLGINVKLKKELGKNLSLEELEKEYDAIYIAIGANISSKMNIEGENLKGVYGGNELLENKNFPELTNKIVVVNGGGNVAIDVARTLNKLGAKVKLIYRRSINEMPAEKEEIIHAQEEGIEFLLQTNIIRINGQKEVKSIECLKTELIKEQNSDRLKPVDIPSSNHEIKCDHVIMAIGGIPEEEIVKKTSLELDNKNRIVINEYYQTSNKKIFAGGDITGIKSTVAFAAHSGKEASENIIKFIKGEI